MLAFHKKKEREWTKLKISKLISLRQIKKESFREVVYEWEEDISNIEEIQTEYIQTQLYDYGRGVFTKKLKDFLYRIKKSTIIDCKKDIGIAFIVVLSDLKYYEEKNCIPIFLDVGLSNVKMIARKYYNRKPFVCTSLDFYKAVKAFNPDIKCYYMPLMISDRWNATSFEKTIDIVQTGRKNKKLHEFALKFIEHYPQYEYIYSDINGTMGAMSYYSTKRGEIEPLVSRADYMKLLRSSRVCLVSSPGIDEPKEWVKGIDFPTPRFYEAAVSKCMLIGRFSDHEEFDIQGVTRVVKRIDTYSEFEEAVLECLVNVKNSLQENYDSFVNDHLTSEWWKRFKNMLERN